MNVIAFSTPNAPDWRWRIVNYAGGTVEESEHTFTTIGRAVEAGARRLERMNVTERAVRPSSSRASMSYLRPR